MMSLFFWVFCSSFFFLFSSIISLLEFKLAVMADRIFYSNKYYDDEHEYRHVILPKEIARHVPDDRLMSETEWRNLGVQQSRGWIHYMRHNPEPHILLFRRRLSAPMPNAQKM